MPSPTKKTQFSSGKYNFIFNYNLSSIKLFKCCFKSQNSYLHEYNNDNLKIQQKSLTAEIYSWTQIWQMRY